MNCQEVDELLGAYALEALDVEAMRQVERHLSYCRLHDQELAELRTAAMALPLSAEHRDPPPRLRDRVLAAFETDRARVQRTAAAGGPAPVRSWPVFPRGWYGFAAVLGVVLIGLAVWAVLLSSPRVGEGPLVRPLQGTIAGGRAIYLAQEQLLVLDVVLPQAPAGVVYQAWTIADGQAASIGVMPANGPAAFSVSLVGVGAVAISMEPAPMSPQPTSAPVLIADFSS